MLNSVGLGFMLGRFRVAVLANPGLALGEVEYDIPGFMLHRSRCCCSIIAMVSTIGDLITTLELRLLPGLSAEHLDELLEVEVRAKPFPAASHVLPPHPAHGAFNGSMRIPSRPLLSAASGPKAGEAPVAGQLALPVVPTAQLARGGGPFSRSSVIPVWTGQLHF